MALKDEIMRGWDDHAEQPEEVARRMEGWVEAAEPPDVPALVSLLVHVLGEHILDPARALALLERLEQRGQSPAIHRGMAVFQLLRGETGEHEAILAKLSGAGPRNTHESRILALAAGCVGARGRAADAARWLVRAATLTYELPDKDEAVRQLAITGNNLACALEEQLKGGTIDPNSEEVKLLRFAASVARTAWERAGHWEEVQLAEYRLAMSSLVVGEPFGAVAHAEACRTICEANGAGPVDLAHAYDLLARARHAIGDSAGVAAAKETLRALKAGDERGQIEAILVALERSIEGAREPK